MIISGPELASQSFRRRSTSTKALESLMMPEWQVERNLDEQLDIIQKLVSLQEQDAAEFIDWYNNNKIRKVIEEIYGRMEVRRVGHSEAEELSNVFLGSADKEKSD